MTADRVIVFDVGSTLIHPDSAALADWLKLHTSEVRDLATVDRAFRLAIGAKGNPRAKSDLTLSEARVFFSNLDFVVDDVRASKMWSEIVLAGGARSWLYSVLPADVKPTLMELKARGWRVIAASNSDGTLHDELEAFDLVHLFEKIYDSASMGVEKPAKEFYAAVLRGFNDAWTVHVGDDLANDCIAPSKLGFDQVILVDPANIYPHVKFCRRVNCVSEVLEHLEGA